MDFEMMPNLVVSKQAKKHRTATLNAFGHSDQKDRSPKNDLSNEEIKNGDNIAS